MVNTAKVNAQVRCLFRAYLCAFFRVFARIPRFKNPVKYIYRSRINYNAEARWLLDEIYTMQYQIVSGARPD